MPTIPTLPVSTRMRNSLTKVSPKNLTASTSTLGSVQISTVEGLTFVEHDINFGATGVEEIFQNVKYIVLTTIWSVPLDREFGIDASFVDKPIPIAQLIIGQEIALKINLYEPRAKFRDITFDGDGLQGLLRPTIIIDIISENEGPSLVPSGAGVLGTGEALTAPLIVRGPDVGAFVQYLIDLASQPGEQGPKGEAATVECGETYTGAPGTNADVENVGTIYDAIFEFTIPRGDKGDHGDNAWTLNIDGFIVPPVGETIDIVVQNSEWIVVGEFLWIEGAGESGEAGSLKVIAKVDEVLTLLNPVVSRAVEEAPYDDQLYARKNEAWEALGTGGVPLADTTQDGLLRKVSGLDTDFVDGTNQCQDLAAAIDEPVRIIVGSIRGFNAIGNSTMEVNQRHNSSISMPIDRWMCAIQGGITGTFAPYDVTNGYGVSVPGTNFKITRSYLRFSSTKQIATLAAADAFVIYTTVEGPRLRELIGDATSAQVLVRSSVAPLTITVALRNAKVTPVRSITMVVTIPIADVWTLLEVPNIAMWPSDSTFLITPGNYGYELLICPAMGSGHAAMSSANDVWQSSTASFWGGQETGNFCAGPVGSTFDIAFVQHEPGVRCGPLIDLPWDVNYEECQRYYAKLSPYGVKFPDGYVGEIGSLYLGTTAIYPSIVFRKQMAKVPIMRYTGNTGVLGQVYLFATGGNVAVANSSAQNSFVQTINLTVAGPATGMPAVLAGWEADTGW
jgi:type IV secretory pathway VirB2 component (pilin)